MFENQGKLSLFGPNGQDTPKRTISPGPDLLLSKGLSQRVATTNLPPTQKGSNNTLLKTPQLDSEPSEVLNTEQDLLDDDEKVPIRANTKNSQFRNLLRKQSVQLEIDQSKLLAPPFQNSLGQKRNSIAQSAGSHRKRLSI